MQISLVYYVASRRDLLVLVRLDVFADLEAHDALAEFLHIVLWWLDRLSVMMIVI